MSRTIATLIALFALSTAIEAMAAAPNAPSEATLAHLKDLKSLEQRLILRSGSATSLQKLRREIIRIETIYGLPHGPPPKKDTAHQQKENVFDLAYAFAMKKHSEGGFGYTPVDARGWAEQQFKYTDHAILLGWMKKRQLEATRRAYAEASMVECVKKNVDLWSD